MIPAPFDYSSPATLSDAFALLKKHGDDAKILSGGHSLIPMMKLRLASPAHIVDINKIPGLSYIKEEGGFLKIGALTREVELEEADIVKKKYPIFVDAAKLIADPQVRNFGTIGGNLAHGDAANDHPAVMLALHAEVVITNEKGTRTVPIDEFFFGFYTTALQHGDILTEIKVPSISKGTGNAYHKIERKVGDYATAGVAVQITIDGDTCKQIGIGLTNVNSTPLRAKRSEEALRGKKVTADLIASAAKMASEDCNPSDDLRGSADFKRQIVKTIVKRMIEKAISRAK
jgi:aerobic carbon-monoxide dehydrogenase medium subunit